MIKEILDKVRAGQLLDKKEAIALLETENNSEDFYRVVSLAAEMTRKEFHNKGYIFAQIGLNAEPCSANCKFCSMGIGHYSLESSWRKDTGSILAEADALVKEGIDDLFLMTTADYPFEDFIAAAKQVKKLLPEQVRFVANIGDFDAGAALRLKEAGFTGVYHIRRLGEGIDTGINPMIRIKTLDAIAEAGLELYYCVEPIGPEHTYEEIAEEMLRARDYKVGVMAVMRRTPVSGTPLFEKGQISSVELAKIAAVARLVTRPYRAMNAHETIQMSLICGVNQLYAEFGANPRDNNSKTEQNRGWSVDKIRRLLSDAEFLV